MRVKFEEKNMTQFQGWRIYDSSKLLFILDLQTETLQVAFPYVWGVQSLRFVSVHPSVTMHETSNYITHEVYTWWLLLGTKFVTAIPERKLYVQYTSTITDSPTSTVESFTTSSYSLSTWIQIRLFYLCVKGFTCIEAFCQSSLSLYTKSITFYTTHFRHLRPFFSSNHR